MVNFRQNDSDGVIKTLSVDLELVMGRCRSSSSMRPLALS